MAGSFRKVSALSFAQCAYEEFEVKYHNPCCRKHSSLWLNAPEYLDELLFVVAGIGAAILAP
jgi:hypothetical protein